MKNPSRAKSGTGAHLGVAIFVLSSVAFLAAQTLMAAPPPQGKTYFTISVGEDSPYGPRVDCLTFTATEVCTSAGLCGSWERTEPPGAETACAFEFSFEVDGVLLEVAGQGRLNDRGKKDSFGAAASVRSGGKSVNFGMAGRSTKARKCRQLLREWTRSHPPAQVAQEASCLEGADFGYFADSEYILPFPAGKDYLLQQAYCRAHSRHVNQLSYDFDIPIGAQITAARAGVVRRVVDDVPDVGEDDPDPNVHNHVFVEHDDGTVGFYAHLEQRGILVEVGQQVESGQLIGYSGQSGAGWLPHLHFGVYTEWPPTEGDDVAVNFRNAAGPLDRRGGLIQDAYYKALRD